MWKKVVALGMVLVVISVFGFSALGRAAETIKAKVEMINKEEKKITLDGKEYTMSDEAAQVDVAVGDEVEATVEQDVVRSLTK